MRDSTSLLTLIIALTLPAAAWSADPSSSTAAAEKSDTKQSTSDASASLKSSTLVGLPVRNAQGEELGTIEDLVIDIKTGQVRYAALSFGGFLGLGDKLFAVPWGSLQWQFDSQAGEHFATMSIDKEQLKNAPGFDKDHWPDFADTRWSDQNDRFYTGARSTDETIK